MSKKDSSNLKRFNVTNMGSLGLGARVTGVDDPYSPSQAQLLNAGKKKKKMSLLTRIKENILGKEIPEENDVSKTHLVEPVNSNLESISCSACGNIVKEKDYFCPECGSKVKAGHYTSNK